MCSLYRIWSSENITKNSLFQFDKYLTPKTLLDSAVGQNDLSFVIIFPQELVPQTHCVKVGQITLL